MNIAFSKIIKADGRNREFNFRKLPADYPSYHVDVTDDKGGRIIFSMHKSANGTWRMTANRLPLWISAFEAMIGEQIEEGEAAFAAQQKGAA